MRTFLVLAALLAAAPASAHLVPVVESSGCSATAPQETSCSSGPHAIGGFHGYGARVADDYVGKVEIRLERPGATYATTCTFTPGSARECAGSWGLDLAGYTLVCRSLDLAGGLGGSGRFSCFTSHLAPYEGGL